jgi:hypothetical protein
MFAVSFWRSETAAATPSSPVSRTMIASMSRDDISSS